MYMYHRRRCRGAGGAKALPPLISQYKGLSPPIYPGRITFIEAVTTCTMKRMTVC